MSRSLTTGAFFFSFFFFCALTSRVCVHIYISESVFVQWPRWGTPALLHPVTLTWGGYWVGTFRLTSSNCDRQTGQGACGCCWKKLLPDWVHAYRPCWFLFWLIYRQQSHCGFILAIYVTLTARHCANLKTVMTRGKKSYSFVDDGLFSVPKPDCRKYF